MTIQGQIRNTTTVTVNVFGQNMLSLVLSTYMKLQLDIVNNILIIGKSPFFLTYLWHFKNW